MMEVSLRMVAPQGKRAEMLDILQCLKGPTEFSRGCRLCRVLQDAEDPNALSYLARWQNQSDLEDHIRSERFRRLLPYIEISAEPPEIEINTLDRVGGVETLIAILGSPIA